MEFSPSPPETRKSFGLLMELIGDPRIAARDRLDIARASAAALEQYVEVKHSFPNLDLALELRNCKHRAYDLAYAKDCQASLGPFTKSQQDELERLSERIFEIPKSIKCPDWYDKHECDRDRNLVEELESKRNKTPLTEREINEKARAVARIASFGYQQSQTPEGKARARIIILSFRRSRLSAEEKDELGKLEALFPLPKREPSTALRFLQALVERNAERSRENRRDK